MYNKRCTISPGLNFVNLWLPESSCEMFTKLAKCRSSAVYMYVCINIWLYIYIYLLAENYDAYTLQIYINEYILQIMTYIYIMYIHSQDKF